MSDINESITTINHFRDVGQFWGNDGSTSSTRVEDPSVKTPSPTVFVAAVRDGSGATCGSSVGRLVCVLAVME